ncbi:MAG: response regulator, partial [Bacteroidales bacterium]|nr:response regulator [Bacteroidales bacterium]
QVDVKKSPFEVDSILNELENYFKLKNDKKNTISFDKKNKNQKLVLNNDSTRFRQIMTNLLNNAMKYTESGFINFGYDIFENEVKFYVSDSGIGISPSEFKNIFDPFHKIERTKTKIYRGAGLGLSICKRLVELMGGKIWLESQLGKGTTFYFTLPFEKAELIFKPTEKKEKIKLNWEGLKILVAEDEPMNFTLIKKILEPSKAEIIWAKDGSEAVDFVKKNSKLSNLIILMDIKMPVMNGIEAFKIIKRINKNIPIIAVTAYAHETDKYEILKSGFSDYIVKPLRPEKLLEIVNMYI